MSFDFSIIQQDPRVRAIVQENLLERAFHDALFPELIFRAEAVPQEWPAGIGDTHVFTGTGLIQPNCQPLRPGAEPTPKSYEIEQWTAQIQQYADAAPDTHMPTDMLAIANLLMRNTQLCGVQAAQSLNRIVRNKLYNAAEAGWTVADGGPTAGTSLRVRSLNGFTRARQSTGTANRVQFAAVSATNPLAVMIDDGGTLTANTVVGYAPDNAGDEVGPGVLTLGSALTAVANRAAVLANDRSLVVNAGGGYRTDDLGANDLPTLSDIRSVLASMRQDNVPPHPDMHMHAHMDPTSESLMFKDSEFQRLFTGVPESYQYGNFVFQRMLGTLFIRNKECPIPSTVVNGTTGSFSVADPFGPDLYNAGANTGMEVHRMLFTGFGGIIEFYSNLQGLISEVGIAGKVGPIQVSMNGIDVFSERIQLVIRQPQGRLQDMISAAWKFIGDWPVRTDSLSGSAKRIKRFGVVRHGVS